MDELALRIKQVDSLLHLTPSVDGEEDLRWQALIAVGEFIEDEPQRVWEAVRRWGCVEDADLRAGVATCLLEHLMEFHFDLLFDDVEAWVLGDAQARDTFARCWKFRQSKHPTNAKRFDELKNRC